MDLSEIRSSIISFLMNNPIIAAVTGLLLLFLIFRKSKLFLTLLFFALILTATFYLIMNIASLGVSKKERLIHKEEKKIEDLQ